MERKERNQPAGARTQSTWGERAMIYFYERRGRFTKCEVHMADDAPYELIVGDADGSNRSEQFTSYHDLVKRLGGLHNELIQRGWDGPHGRDL